MKDTEFTQIVDEVIALNMTIIDDYVKEEIEPLIKSVGNPESLIGKKYEEWTPQDLQLMVNVYGEGDDSPLSKLIFEKSYTELIELEEV